MLTFINNVQNSEYTEVWSNQHELGNPSGVNVYVLSKKEPWWYLIVFKSSPNIGSLDWTVIVRGCVCTLIFSWRLDGAHGLYLTIIGWVL